MVVVLSDGSPQEEKMDSWRTEPPIKAKSSRSAVIPRAFDGLQIPQNVIGTKRTSQAVR